MHYDEAKQSVVTVTVSCQMNKFPTFSAVAPQKARTVTQSLGSCSTALSATEYWRKKNNSHYTQIKKSGATDRLGEKGETGTKG